MLNLTWCTAATALLADEKYTLVLWYCGSYQLVGLCSHDNWLGMYT